MTRCVLWATLVVLVLRHAFLLAADVPEMAIVHSDVETGFANAGWKYDRYSDLPSLDAWA